MAANSTKSRKAKGLYRHSKTPSQYLIQRVSRKGACLEWTRGVDKDGYGQCQDARVARALGVTRAHQLAYARLHGRIPKGMFVCHKCDNPKCIRASHLFLGTALDNNRDMMTKGRNVWGNTKIKANELEFILSSPLSSLALEEQVSVCSCRIRQLRRRHSYGCNNNQVEKK